MADDTKIINGSFKGIPISVNSSNVDGGRKVVVNQYPNKDTQSVEDMGGKPRRYSLQIVVSAKKTEDYFSYRDSLIAAFESSGPGVLIHPLYGRIENMVAVSFSLNERMDSFGDTTINVEFEQSINTGIPQRSISSITQVASANDLIRSSVNFDIADRLNISKQFTDNFTAVKTKITDLVGKARSAISFLGNNTDKLSFLTSVIDDVENKINSLISVPSDLANSITGLFGDVKDLFPSQTASFKASSGFFDFGSDDVPKHTTVGLSERSSNSAVINGSVAALSLGNAYEAAVQIDYKNSIEIDEIKNQLDSQYEAVMVSESSQDVKDAVTEARILVLDSLDVLRVNTPQVVDVYTKGTSARLLAFSLYGNDNNGENLVDLNGINDVSFIEGDIKVLTS